MEVATPGERSVSLVRVWDVPVRVFHWTLVALVTTSFVTGKIGGNAMQYHMWSGYAILALVTFRIVWGFVGGTHARFGDFLYGVKRVVGFARELFSREHSPYLGHNPWGGWMVLALLLLLLAQASMGLFADDDIATRGPLANLVSEKVVSLCSKLHDLNGNLLIALVVAHIAAVLFHKFYKGEPLITAMVSGRKPLPSGVVAPASRDASTWWAVLILLVTASAVAFVVKVLPKLLASS